MRPDGRSDTGDRVSRRLSRTADGASDPASTRRPASALGLTPRQTDVLELLLQGQSNKLIARALNLSVETIKDHVAAVLRTLNVSSRTQAVPAVSQRVGKAPPSVSPRQLH